MNTNEYKKVEKCIYRRIKDKKYIVDLFTGVDKNGKQIRSCKTYSTLKEARLALQEFKWKKQSNQIMILPMNKHLKELVDDYIKNISTLNLEETTVASHLNIAKHINNYFGNKKLIKIMPSDITKYFLHMQKQGLKISTLKKHFSFFNSIFKYAIYMKSEYGVIDNPMNDVLPLKSSVKTEPKFLEPDDVLKIRDVLINENNELYFPFMIAILTGMRRGEILALKISDIDFERNKIYITKNRVAIGSRVVDKFTTKTHMSRTIEISKHLKPLLDEKIKTMLAKKSSNSKYNENEFLLVDEKSGKEYNPTLLSVRFSRFIKRHPELKQIKFHELRHSYISNAMIYGNANISDVARTVGNSKEICLRIYAHASSEGISRTVDSYDKIFENSL